jgi:hypothetical protein
MRDQVFSPLTGLLWLWKFVEKLEDLLTRKDPPSKRGWGTPD